MASKQERYNELAANEDNLTNEEQTEQVQLHYEIDPVARKYFKEVAPDSTPQDVWGIDTSRYK